MSGSTSVTKPSRLARSCKIQLNNHRQARDIIHRSRVRCACSCIAAHLRPAAANDAGACAARAAGLADDDDDATTNDDLACADACVPNWLLAARILSAVDGIRATWVSAAVGVHATGVPSSARVHARASLLAGVLPGILMSQVLMLVR